MHKMLTYPGATPVEDSFSLMSSHGSVVRGGEEMKNFQFYIAFLKWIHNLVMPKLWKCAVGFRDALTRVWEKNLVRKCADSI